MSHYFSATPAGIGAGAAGGAAFFGALGGVVDHVLSSKSKDDDSSLNVVRFPWGQSADLARMPALAG